MTETPPTARGPRSARLLGQRAPEYPSRGLRRHEGSAGGAPARAPPARELPPCAAKHRTTGRRRTCVWSEQREPDVVAGHRGEEDSVQTVQRAAVGAEQAAGVLPAAAA